MLHLFESTSLCSILLLGRKCSYRIRAGCKSIRRACWLVFSDETYPLLNLACTGTGGLTEKKKLCRQRKLSLHQLRKRRYIGSDLDLDLHGGDLQKKRKENLRRQ